MTVFYCYAVRFVSNCPDEKQLLNLSENRNVKAFLHEKGKPGPRMEDPACLCSLPKNDHMLKKL